MKLIIGFLTVIFCVFGGYVLAHGVLLALWQPFELLIIAGGAFGAFIIANPTKVIKSVFSNLPMLLKGPKYDKESYRDLLTLMYKIFAKMRKDGALALEDHIDDPHNSTLFQQHPAVLANHHAMDFLTDYLRLIVSGNMNAFQIENLMDVELETHHQEFHMTSDSVNKVSDGLPGFGIVAAVMGVVITMGSLGEPPEILGAHIAAALVGTFLGILLAYGFVGPMASALEHNAREEGKYLECIKVCILATLNGYAPPVAIEFGRKVLFSTERPSFHELEEHIQEEKRSAQST